jgi:hypothetical protein
MEYVRWFSLPWQFLFIGSAGLEVVHKKAAIEAAFQYWIQIPPCYVGIASLSRS